MVNKILTFLLITLLVFVASIFFSKNSFFSNTQTVSGTLLDPEQAPLDIHNSIMRGYRIIMNTPFYASNYAGDQLSCTHCHFVGGETFGGRNNGISLVGVTLVYPTYSERDRKIISLAERINQCFERSLNGSSLPLHSDEMQDILAYLKWISKDVKSSKEISWLGLIPLKSSHVPSFAHGEFLYTAHCAACHKEDGEGSKGVIAMQGKVIPPLWGAHSFNTGAGMNQLATLSAFIYWNMPYMDAHLKEEEAIDLAAFIIQQPRPQQTQNFRGNENGKNI